MDAHGWRLRPLPLRAGMLGSALVVVVSAALWWTNRTDGRLHLIVPAIPGDGILLKSPGGRVALIDGGADGTAVANWLGGELPLGRRRIDLLVLTRADETTLPGQLAAVRRYHVRQAVLAEPVEAQPLWDELVRLLGEQGTSVHVARERDRLILDGTQGQKEVVIEVLSVAEGRLTLDLTTGTGRVLLLQSLADEPLPPAVGRRPVAAVIYPWRRTTHDPALEALAPEVIVFGERPGRDPQLTLAERRIGSAKLLHEALDGRIDLQFDLTGMNIAVTQQRGN